MSSPPPLTRQELQGSSRTTGGIFRGRALGNHPKAADLAEEDDSLIPKIGKVFIYITRDDPQALDVMKANRQRFNHVVTKSLAQVLQAFGDYHSPIRRKS